MKPWDENHESVTMEQLRAAIAPCTDPDCGLTQTLHLPALPAHSHPVVREPAATTGYTSCGFESCTTPATGYAEVKYGDWIAERRSACDGHGSDGTLTAAH